MQESSAMDGKLPIAHELDSGNVSAQSFTSL